jgi:AraC family transcriptional activator of pyochelin receptor
MALDTSISSPTRHSSHTFFDEGIRLECCQVRPRREVEVEEQMHCGLKLVVFHGSMRYRSNAMRKAEMVCGSTMFVISDDGCNAGSQAFTADVEQRYLVIRIDPRWIMTELGTEPGDIHRRLGGIDGKPLVLHNPANQTICALANQLAYCPAEGALQRLLLGSQVLALTAAMLAPQIDPGTLRTSGELRGNDMDRLHSARRLLLDDLRNPPPLSCVATAVGMSTRKLEAGFRCLFGVTPAKYLREQRLQQAWHWLASDQYQVSEVAWMSGFGFAHFSTAFRRRFGLSPADLKRR